MKLGLRMGWGLGWYRCFFFLVEGERLVVFVSFGVGVVLRFF